MGNSLHNKIYLGRRHALLGTRRAQVLLACGAAFVLAMLWVIGSAVK